MAEDDGAVAGEMQIGFDTGGAGVESGLEGGQRVFGAEAAGAAVALEVERPSASWHGVGGKNLAGRNTSRRGQHKEEVVSREMRAVSRPMPVS